MVEIVFSRSAGGSLKQARHYGEGPFQGVVGAVFYKGGSKPTKKKRREAQERARRLAREEWDAAVPMGEALGEVFPLPLALSVGPLSTDLFGPERVNTLASLRAESPPPVEAAAEMLKQAEQSFDAVMERAGAGEEVRIWRDGLPDDQCAFCWLLSRLSQLENRGKIWLLDLPPYTTRTDGVVIQHWSWGEVGPGEWAGFLPLQREVPDNLCRAMVHEWAMLQEENAPLRAVVNGQLCGVGEDFYDPFILRELAAQPQEFHQAAFIGNILRKYRLGISDGWITLRMEKWIQQGLLEAVTEPGRKDPVIYRRYLRKAPNLPCLPHV